MHRQDTEDGSPYQKRKNSQIDRSLEDCLNGIDGDIDMGMFLNNLKELNDEQVIHSNTIHAMENTEVYKNQMRRKQEQADKEDRRKEKEMKRQAKAFRNKSKSNGKVEELGEPIKQPYSCRVVIQNKSADILNRKIDNLNKIMKDKIETERGRAKTPKKITSNKFNKVYGRFQNHQLKAQAKLNALKSEKLMVEEKELTFKPKINKGKDSRARNFFDYADCRQMNREEKRRLKEIESKRREEEEEAKNCTFKPKIKEVEHIPQRSIADLYKWKNDLEYKKMKIQKKKEDALQKEHTFAPQINKNYQKKQIGEFNNAGERLYAIHNAKQKERLSRRKISGTSVKKLGKKRTVENPIDLGENSQENSLTMSRDELMGFTQNPNKKSTNKKKKQERVNFRPADEIFNADYDDKPYSTNKLEKTDEHLKLSSTNFMTKNRKKIKETEKKIRRDKEELKKRVSRSKSGKKYYNAKKDKKVKIAELKSYVDDIADLKDCFDP